MLHPLAFGLVGYSVQDILLKRPGSHTPSTPTWWNVGNGCHRGCIMRNKLPIPRQTILGAVEERRVNRIVRVFIPRPVGLVAIVAAFVAKGLFERPGVVAVPG